MSADVKNKLQDVAVQNITNQITVRGVITTLILVDVVVEVTQATIIQTMVITKVDLAGIKVRGVDRNICSFCCINKNFAYNTLDVLYI